MAASQSCKLKIERFNLMSKRTEQLGKIITDLAKCSGWVDYPRPHNKGKRVRPLPSG